MSALRFSKTNKLDTIHNGAGGGAPATFQTSPWVDDNALTASRKVLWQGTGSGDLDAGISGGNTSVQVIGLLGIRGAPSTAAGITSVTFSYQAGTYTPGGAFTTPAGASGLTVNAVGRNIAVFLSAAVTAATIRFSITASTAFTVGRVFAGTIEQSLALANGMGVLFSPGRIRTPVTPESRNEGIDQSPAISSIGDTFYEYQLPYEGADDTLRAQLETIGTWTGPFLMHDGWASDIQECVRVSDRSYSNALIWDGSPGFHNDTLTIRSLG